MALVFDYNKLPSYVRGFLVYWGRGKSLDNFTEEDLEKVATAFIEATMEDGAYYQRLYQDIESLLVAAAGKPSGVTFMYIAVKMKLEEIMRNDQVRQFNEAAVDELAEMMSGMSKL